jgi:hypothetical protein
MQLGVHPVAVDLTLTQTMKGYTMQIKVHNKQGTHNANPNV